MTEILTESFCERCGTRYTFESAAPRKSRLARVRVLSKGVRNFVMSDDASLSEAMADARNEEELAATTFQLDAFHQTFNFCLTCRQYTCSDCWNDTEGRCLTCAPLPGQDEPVALIDLAPAVTVAASPTNGHDALPAFDPEAWPEADLPAERGEAIAEEIAPAGTGGSPAEPADIAPELPHISGLAPGQSLDDAIAAYEALLESDTSRPQPGGVSIGPEIGAEAEPVASEAVMVEAQPFATVPAPPIGTGAEPAEVDVSAEPERVAAEAEPPSGSAQPPAAAEPPAAAASPAAEAPGPAARDDIAQPVWPAPAVPQPHDTPAPPAPSAPAPAAPPSVGQNPPSPWLTVAPDEPVPPQWPAAPQWPSAAARRDAPLTLAGRTLLPEAGATALWAASAQEVLGAAPVPLAPSAATATPQPCVSCGLPLSANARFCRRCGSRQG